MIRVDVRPGDIARGRPDQPFASAVALACQRAIGGGLLVSVGWVTISFWRSRDYGYIRTPAAVRSFLAAEDEGTELRPFAFDLEVPDLDRPPAPRPPAKAPAKAKPAPQARPIAKPTPITTPRPEAKPAPAPKARSKPSQPAKPQARSLFHVDRSYG